MHVLIFISISTFDFSTNIQYHCRSFYNHTHYPGCRCCPLCASTSSVTFSTRKPPARRLSSRMLTNSSHPQSCPSPSSVDLVEGEGVLRNPNVNSAATAAARLQVKVLGRLIAFSFPIGFCSKGSQPAPPPSPKPDNGLDPYHFYFWIWTDFEIEQN